MCIPTEVRAEIKSRLVYVEKQYGVSILYACESGSRAWGFPSANSDYDVRFIYVRPAESYLAIRPVRDVIEIPIVDEIDLSGWDLQKALYLLYKSNPALLEWLSCPIVYYEDELHFKPFRALSITAFKATAAFHHYRSMARQHIARMSTGELVRLKHYLYTIRPILACNWILRNNSQPPMLFSDLVDAIVGEDSVRGEIDRLLKLKAAAEEIKEIPHVPAVMSYITEQLAFLEQSPVPDAEISSIAKFNDVFRTMLLAVD